MSDPNDVIYDAGGKKLTRGQAEAVVADRVKFLTLVCDTLESNGAALSSLAEDYDPHGEMTALANRSYMFAVCIGSVLLPMLRAELGVAPDDDSAF